MAGTARLSPKNETLLDAGLLNAALEAFPVGLAITEKGRILYANPSFAQRFGPAQERDMQEEIAALRPQASVADFQINGRGLQIISTAVVTASSEAQKMEAIGRLVSGVAHDFNNLLTGIMLYCDLLLAGMKDDHLRRHAEEIRMAGEHGAALVEQLMAVARRETVEPQLLSWNLAVQDMGNLLRRLVGENIDLITDLAGDLGLVKIAPARAHQIILNLVLNARDAMPQGGRITLSTRNVPTTVRRTGRQNGSVHHIEFAVADTGLGMDDHTRSQAFQPFFTTKKAGRGNGIGLATVYDLVQQADGDIEIRSIPEKGTRVVIQLPCAVEDSPSVTAISPEDPKEGKHL